MEKYLGSKGLRYYNSKLKTLMGEVARGGQRYYNITKVNGDSDPANSLALGSKDELLDMLSHLKMGYYNNSGKLVNWCAPGRITLAEDGTTALKVDGSNGDLMIGTDTTMYMDRYTADIPNEGTTSNRNVYGIGMLPGKMSRKLDPFAITPHYTVNAKLSGDARSCAHSVYNESATGMYNTPVALFKQTLKANGNGYPSAYMSAIDSSVQARNKNADPSTNTPFIGLYHDYDDFWQIAMYLELGTLDFTQPTVFGYGCSNATLDASTFADAGMSGISGMKMITSSGDTSYCSLWGSFFIGTNTTSYPLINGIAGGQHFAFTPMLEPLRILDNITANGHTDCIGDSTKVLTDLGATAITDGSVNLSTGEGMTAGQKYIQVRNVPNCQGLADGVMTAVVNVYIKVEFADNIHYDSATGTDLTGAIGIFKLSYPVYRGKVYLSGMFTQTEGAHWLQVNDNGTFRSELWECDNVDNLPVITSSTTWNGDVGVTLGYLNGYTKVLEEGDVEGWMKTVDITHSLYGIKTAGGSQHTYECGYIWKGHTSWSYGDGNMLTKTNKQSLNACVVGCSSYRGSAGRTAHCFIAVSNGYDACAGAFALSHPSL